MRKFLRVIHKGEIKQGYVDAERVVCLSGNFWDSPKETGESFALGEIQEWLSPVMPSKLIAIGLNYKKHAAEFNLSIPEQPVSFLKSTTSITGHKAGIIYPAGLSRVVDYEAELAVVIGKEAYKISENESLDYIFGYTCANDVSARDIQKRDGQWMLCKSFNTFNPLGPWIVSGMDASNIRVMSRLNGAVKQDSMTSDMIFGVPYLVHFLSQVMPLLPGDVIITGTPSGVGRMKEGDKIEIELQGIGILENTVII